MAGTLVELIEKNMELLVDGITKEAIQRIPSYGEAPIKQTLGRMERMLGVLVDSIRRNHPDVLEQYLMGIAEERREQAYPVGELHAVFDVMEHHLQDLVVQATADEVERNAHLALVDATMASARMILSKAYLLLAKSES
jgi:hypothetical protein